MRTLIATTALALVLSGPALSQAQNDTQLGQGQQNQPMQAGQGQEMQAGQGQPLEAGQGQSQAPTGGFYSPQGNELLIARLMGVDVYLPQSQQQGADGSMQAQGGQGGSEIQPRTVTEQELGQMENVGQVQNVILGSNGEVRALVVEVGGFLGIGNRQVAIDVSQVQFARNEGDPSQLYVVSRVGADTLQNAPEFSEQSFEQGQQLAQGSAGGQQPQQGGSQQGQASGETTVVIIEEPTGNAAAGQQGEQQNQQQNQVAQGESATGGGVQEAQPQDQAGATQVMPEEQRGAEGEQAQADEGLEENEAEFVVQDETEARDELAGADWRGGRAPMIAPGMEREGYQMAEPGQFTAESLMNANVYDANDENIGSVSDVVLNPEGQLEAVVLDVGGFLGFGSHTVAIGLDEMTILTSEAGDLRAYVDVTEEQLEQMPQYEGEAG